MAFIAFIALKEHLLSVNHDFSFFLKKTHWILHLDKFREMKE